MTVSLFSSFFIFTFAYKRLPTHFPLLFSYTKTNHLANLFTFYLLYIIVETTNVAHGKHFELRLSCVGIFNFL